MNQDTRAINKLNCPDSECFTSASDGVDKHHSPNVKCTWPDGKGRHVAPARICFISLASTSRTTVFLHKRHRHVRRSQINSGPVGEALHCFFHLIAFVWANHSKTSEPPSPLWQLLQFAKSFRLLFLTRNKMSLIIWCPKTISGLFLSPAWTSSGSSKAVTPSLSGIRIWKKTSVVANEAEINQFSGTIVSP